MWRIRRFLVRVLPVYVPYMQQGCFGFVVRVLPVPYMQQGYFGFVVRVIPVSYVQQGCFGFVVRVIPVSYVQQGCFGFVVRVIPVSYVQQGCLRGCACQWFEGGKEGQRLAGYTYGLGVYFKNLARVQFINHKAGILDTDQT